MASVKIDPAQKLKVQVATHKETIRELKATIRELKQAMKAQKVDLQSAWQTEIEAHAEHALSVGYELGYLEAISVQKDTMRRLRRECEVLQNNLQTETQVDYSALDSVLSAAGGQRRVVPMPEPAPAVLVEPAPVVEEPVVEEPKLEAAEASEPAALAIEESVAPLPVEKEITMIKDPFSQPFIQEVKEELVLEAEPV